MLQTGVASLYFASLGVIVPIAIHVILYWSYLIRVFIYSKLRQQLQRQKVTPAERGPIIAWDKTSLLLRRVKMAVNSRGHQSMVSTKDVHRTFGETG
jgi:hypothetical protein